MPSYCSYTRMIIRWCEEILFRLLDFAVWNFFVLCRKDLLEIATVNDVTGFVKSQTSTKNSNTISSRFMIQKIMRYLYRHCTYFERRRKISYRCLLYVRLIFFFISHLLITTPTNNYIKFLCAVIIIKNIYGCITHIHKCVR